MLPNGSYDALNIELNIGPGSVEGTIHTFNNWVDFLYENTYQNIHVKLVRKDDGSPPNNIIYRDSGTMHNNPDPYSMHNNPVLYITRNNRGCQISWFSYFSLLTTASDIELIK